MKRNKWIKIVIDTIFFAIHLVVIYILIKNGRPKYDGVIGVALFYLTFNIVEKKYEVDISNHIRILIVLTMLGHSFFGRYLNLYVRTSHFDTFLHVFGTYSFTLFTYTMIEQLFNVNFAPGIKRTIFIISLGISLGSLFELVEFTGDMAFHPKRRHQVSLMDTNIDLIADVFGAVIASVKMRK